MKRILLFCYFCSTCCLAQTYRKEEINLELFVEELFAMQEEDAYEDMYETLLQHFQQPINLNKTTPEELKSLYLLSPNQLNSFFTYKATFGDLISIYELQAIPHFDLQTIYRLLPFVGVGEEVGKEGSIFSRIANTRDAYLIFRNTRTLEERRGFTPPDTLRDGRLSSRYLGDPYGSYIRFRIQKAKDFSFGFTMEKDPGEQWVWNPSKNQFGYDFFSYHLTLYNQKKIKTLTIGDYQMQTGQGLVFGSGFSVGKGAETITTIRRSHVGLRPYTAAMEFGFFRGVASTMQFGNLQLTLMASEAPRDGSLNILSQDSIAYESIQIASLPISGLHRTANEIGRRHTVRETNLGANLHLTDSKKAFQVGANFLKTGFNKSFERNPNVYNQFEFSGQQNWASSIYWSYGYQNHLLFGESAISKSLGQGHVVGLMSSLHPKISYSMLWRKYDKNFHSFYGNAFSESSRPINESGLYMGLNFRPNRNWAVAMYHDRFNFPWLKFRIYAPSSGSEWLARIAYSPSRQKLLFFQFREELKARNLRDLPDFQATYQIAAGRKRNMVVNLDLALDKQWSIKSRVTASSYHLGSSHTTGFAISQDLNFDQGRWRISSRIALFDTDDFDNRQYIYERNVLWFFSVPPLHGQGMRYYMLGQYRISQKLTVWSRFARTSFTDRDRIGSGLQQIPGSRQTDVVFQIRYQFNR
jgi:hypothetical protein